MGNGGSSPLPFQLPFPHLNRGYLTGEDPPAFTASPASHHLQRNRAITSPASPRLRIR